MEVWAVPPTLVEQLLADFKTLTFDQDKHDKEENKTLRGGKEFPLNSHVKKLTKPYKELLTIVKSKEIVKRFASTRKPYVVVRTTAPLRASPLRHNFPHACRSTGQMRATEAVTATILDGTWTM